MKSGRKFVLRTDIMFTRIQQVQILAQAYLEDERWKQAESFYQKSNALQAAGDPKGSTEAFLQAVELHAALSSLRAQRRSAPDESIRTVLSKDLWCSVAIYLSLHDCVANLSRVNSYFCSMIRSCSRLWQYWFVRRWGHDGRKLLQICSSLGDHCITYYLAFKARIEAEKSFNVFR